MGEKICNQCGEKADRLTYGTCLKCLAKKRYENQGQDDYDPDSEIDQELASRQRTRSLEEVIRDNAKYGVTFQKLED